MSQNRCLLQVCTLLTPVTAWYTFSNHVVFAERTRTDTTEHPASRTSATSHSQQRSRFLLPLWDRSQSQNINFEGHSMGVAADRRSSYAPLGAVLVPLPRDSAEHPVEPPEEPLSGSRQHDAQITLARTTLTTTLPCSSMSGESRGRDPRWTAPPESGDRDSQSIQNSEGVEWLVSDAGTSSRLFGPDVDSDSVASTLPPPYSRT